MSSQEEKKSLEHQTFIEPFKETAEVIRIPLVEARQPVYTLSNQEFRDLKNGDSRISAITSKLLAVAIGYVVLLVAKYVTSEIYNIPSGIQEWEPIAAIVAIVLFSVTSFSANKFLPTRRKKQIRRIEKYFEKNPESFHLMMTEETNDKKA